MKLAALNFWGKSKYWWTLLALGILTVVAGVWIMMQPMVGYSVIALLFGYALLIGGIFQIAISTNVRKEVSGWGWWLAGGIFDLLVGILLVADLVLAEASLPYFFAFIFLFKGIASTVGSFAMDRANRYWWLYLLNGILMIILAWMFFVYPFAGAFTIVFLSAFMLMYWGISLVAFSFDVRPAKK